MAARISGSSSRPRIFRASLVVLVLTVFMVPGPSGVCAVLGWRGTPSCVRLRA
jgi:hypothetical protein